jgi:MFS family permease
MPTAALDEVPTTKRRLQLGRAAGFAAVAYAFLVAMLSTTLPTPLYSLYQAQYGFDQLMVTVIFAVYAAGVIASLLLFGRLSDQIGRRLVLLPGIALAMLSAGVFLAADGVGWLMLGRVLSGLSAGLFTGAATAALLDLANPANRQRATLIATVVNMGGLGCGALVAGLLAEWAGSPLTAPFWLDLALLIPAAIGLWLVPEMVARKAQPTLRPQRLRVPAAVRPTFVRAALAAFAGFAVLGVFTAVAPAFLGKVLGVTNHAVIGLVVFSVFAASSVGQIALDRIPDKARALQLGCVGLIIGMALLALGLDLESLTLLVIGGLAAGFGQGLSFRAGLASLSAESPADHRAEVVSSFFVVAYVAISIPVVGVGLLAQETNLRLAGTLFAGVVSLLALIVLWLLSRHRPGAAPAAA